ncbi:MAG TPA: SDR family oxidoreductase [Acidimicrobiales bacterium]|jgi:NAD(P)-dependent dehydrogenase (short-subunit alcohol dehydrogenase family)|nr:SDR family oxidoreductase [Acidimicrobiales bacterium]
MKTVVVGASSGLGRCIGTGLAARGAQVALLARRHDRLVDAAKDAGPGSLAIACDVTDPDSCRAAVDEAAAGLGGIDAVVYTPAIGPLARITDVDPETWHRVFDTNVVGAASITAAALPHLQESHGVAAYLSSVSASTTDPWPGLASYTVTKAALNKLIDAWRAEHPTVGFSRITVGDCIGGEGPGMTEFASGWDMDLMMELHPIWQERSLLAGCFIDIDDLVTTVHHVLSAGASVAIPSVIVQPRPQS